MKRSDLKMSDADKTPNRYAGVDINLQVEFRKHIAANLFNRREVVRWSKKHSPTQSLPGPYITPQNGDLWQTSLRRGGTLALRVIGRFRLTDSGLAEGQKNTEYSQCCTDPPEKIGAGGIASRSAGYLADFGLQHTSQLAHKVPEHSAQDGGDYDEQ